MYISLFCVDSPNGGFSCPAGAECPVYIPNVQNRSKRRENALARVQKALATGGWDIGMICHCPANNKRKGKGIPENRETHTPCSKFSGYLYIGFLQFSNHGASDTRGGTRGRNGHLGRHQPTRRLRERQSWCEGTSFIRKQPQTSITTIKTADRWEKARKSIKTALLFCDYSTDFRSTWPDVVAFCFRHFGTNCPEANSPTGSGFANCHASCLPYPRPRTRQGFQIRCPARCCRKRVFPYPSCLCR